MSLSNVNFQRDHIYIERKRIKEIDLCSQDLIKSECFVLKIETKFCGHFCSIAVDFMIFVNYSDIRYDSLDDNAHFRHFCSEDSVLKTS